MYPRALEFFCVCMAYWQLHWPQKFKIMIHIPKVDILYSCTYILHPDPSLALALCQNISRGRSVEWLYTCCQPPPPPPLELNSWILIASRVILNQNWSKNIKHYWLFLFRLGISCLICETCTHFDTNRTHVNDYYFTNKWQDAVRI